MKTRKYFESLAIILMAAVLVSCSSPNALEKTQNAKGSLFIIGGGHKSAELVSKMVQLANLDSAGYVLILPMSSGYQDTAIFYDSTMFAQAGIKHIEWIKFDSSNNTQADLLKKLSGAQLIYLSGGDQTKFMKAIENSTIAAIIQEAYFNGATVAGTSAGASLMSKKMITGNQIKHPVYTGDFGSIESGNIELTYGLGLLPVAIIDQHFIKRQRMNRLLAAVIENPDCMGIGIDESTAIYVHNNQAQVLGENQVIVTKLPSAISKSMNGLLGAENMELSIYLAGDTFSLDKP